MFCYQCEQTAKSVACTVKGVCGKEDEVASLQDNLICCLKGLALMVEQAAPRGLVPADTYPFLAEGMFVTFTNVNFDSQAIKAWADEAVGRREALRAVLLKEQPGATFADGGYLGCLEGLAPRCLHDDLVEGVLDYPLSPGLLEPGDYHPHRRLVDHGVDGQPLLVAERRNGGVAQRR